jgi:hypothetical protein
VDDSAADSVSDYAKCQAPPGRSGAWVLERFEVAPAAPATTASGPDCAQRRPGLYSRLRREGEVFMTDLYDEWWTQRVAILEACRRGGSLLVTGLGLGLVVESILGADRGRVRAITVLEQSPDVIRLIAPTLLARYPGRLRVEQADAFGWQPLPGRRFDLVWHDIWPNPYAAEVESEMQRLEARYRAHCEWQGCWPREYLWVYDRVPWTPIGAM